MAKEKCIKQHLQYGEGTDDKTYFNTLILKVKMKPVVEFPSFNATNNNDSNS